MKRMTQFTIDVEKGFPRLPHAPIVEAVVQWQAIPTRSLDQSRLQSELTTRFPEFAMGVQHEVETAFSGSPTAMGLHQRLQGDGFRLTSPDERHICQFKPKMVIFSRLAPYEGWESFLMAAWPFWKAFLELMSPIAVDRLGVRFISQIVLKDREKVSDYVGQVSTPLKRLGLRSTAFFHQDTIPSSGYPFQVNLIRALRPPQPPLVTQETLIVDIDVTTIDTTPLEAVEPRLRQMRFIKNEVFFTVMKEAEKKFG